MGAASALMTNSCKAGCKLHMQRLNLARASKLKDVALMSTDMPESDGDILKAVSLGGVGLSEWCGKG